MSQIPAAIRRMPARMTGSMTSRIPGFGGRTRTTTQRLTDHVSALPRPSAKAVMAGGAMIAGTLLAIPMTRMALRTVGERMNDRRHTSAAGERALDPLTGLPNHAEAVFWLHRRMERARAHKRRLAVLVLDLDDFAAANEEFGRAAGDHILQVTAARLQALLRTGDMVCRTGNDTFLVLMDVTGPDHVVAAIGERIVDAVAEPISHGEDKMVISASLGFAISTDRERDPDLLLGRADRAVIQAKASERPIVQF